MPVESNNANFGAFISTTNVWDTSQLYSVDIKSPEFKELLVRLYQNVNNISTILNLKDTGYYDVQEFVNGQLFFPNPALSSSTAQTPSYRQVYRLVVDFGALPNATTKSVAHGLTIGSGYSFTRIYGCATNPSTEFIPLPYSSSTANNNIELNVDTTNVNVTTSIDYSAYTKTYIILEYITQ